MAFLRWVTVTSLALSSGVVLWSCGADDDPGFKLGQGTGGTDASTGGATGGNAGAVTGGVAGSAGAAGIGGSGGVGGSNDGGPCPPGQQICGQVCIDPEVDPSNCGSCGHDCQDNEACENGVCATSCAPGQIACSGGCFDPESDNSHCGSCNNDCSGGSSCQSGVCVCPGGLSLCGDACVDLKTDGSHCGSCSTTCTGGKSCVSSSCVCPAGEESCGNLCTDTDNDPLNCGTCGTQCTAPNVCSAGLCVLNCTGPTTKCGNACVNLQMDPENCGACGTQCAVGQNCVSGNCVCPFNGTLCGGQCVNTQINNSHCGGCGIVCTGGKSCVSGSCVCPPGQITCDGQCANQGSPCNDNSACTLNDSCQPSGCIGTPLNCADSNACTVDSCSPATGCVHTPASPGATCDDNDACTTGDACQAGAVCAGKCPSPFLLFAPDSNVTLSAIQFTPQDVIAYDSSTSAYSMYFDGSDVGISGARIDAIHVMNDGQILLSFDAQIGIAGLIGGPNGTTVEASDLVRFTPTSIGNTTAGGFTFHFDGSDVGLIGNSIDGVGIIQNGDYLISVANGVLIGTLMVENEDVVSFKPTSLGATTAGTFNAYFDHSSTSVPYTLNVDGANFRASDGALLLTPSSQVPGLLAEDEDIYSYSFTTGAFAIVFDGSAHGFTADANGVAMAQWKIGCSCQ
jgi:hypothetical protein